MSTNPDRFERQRHAAGEFFRLLAQARSLDAARSHRAAQAQRDEAGLLLVTHFGRLIRSMGRRSGCSDEQAEELVQDVYMKLHEGSYAISVDARTVILSCASSLLIDQYRRATAQRRSSADGRTAEVAVDEETWDYLGESVAGDDVWRDFDLRDCIQKNLARFHLSHPRSAGAIELWAQGFEGAEMAAILFGRSPDEITPAQKATVRQRIQTGREELMKLLQECKALLAP